MKIKIQQRQVYHKFAEIEIKIPNDVDEFDIQDYVNDNEHLWVDKMDKQMSESEFDFGAGLYDYEGMDEAESDSEWRYDCPDLKIGGHL